MDQVQTEKKHKRKLIDPDVPQQIQPIEMAQLGDNIQQEIDQNVTNPLSNEYGQIAPPKETMTNITMPMENPRSTTYLQSNKHFDVKNSNP